VKTWSKVLIYILLSIADTEYFHLNLGQMSIKKEIDLNLIKKYCYYVLHNLFWVYLSAVAVFNENENFRDILIYCASQLDINPEIMGYMC